MQILLLIAVIKQMTVFQDVQLGDYVKVGHVLRDPHLFNGAPTAGPSEPLLC